jgi:hypothetical protein
MPNAERGMRNVLCLFCILHFALFIGACSIPSLESPDCAAARDAVKEFYSFHFGNDMTVTTDNLKARQRFLTPEFFGTLSSQSGTNVDPFTKADTPPKTFKIAKCTQVGSDKADVAVQIYWRYETGKVDQRELHVETIKSGDTWLINKVSN